ncbi:ketopantoate reductase C-terminal domain-containing protein [Verrucomicrobium sp. BvORR034]|uniref:ketopantoate reductase family protein n=1 Tax=Verrucomicrobium sp. BvORR034 TaxID=1396418 RepID=UPI0007C7AC7C|nr:ketopantoate reductase C-terminal domain-containing protein [Verrucomicrobium sp. BvORR034]
MEPVYVIGCGAVGVPLMACLAAAGRPVIGVRASEEDAPEQTVTVPVTVADQALDLPLQTVGIGRLGEIKGPVVIATKAHANAALARRLAPLVSGPVIIMQNGLGVERPFVEAGFQEIYRSVLYVVSEGDLKKGFRFRAVTPSPVGVVTGTQERLQACLAALHTVGFPLRAEADIQREAWTKTIINCVFNAVCPLLEVDNSLFSKHEEARDLARKIVTEGVTLANRLGIPVEVEALMERVLKISANSTQAISTLQDLRENRETEIDYLNLELARIAAALEPPASLPITETLGRMIALKSRLGRGTGGAG